LFCREQLLVPEKLLEFATHYTSAWGSQEPARVASFFSPEGSLTINGGGPCVGRAEITAAAQSFMTALPDLSLRMDRLIEERSVILYTGRFGAPTPDREARTGRYASGVGRSGDLAPMA